MGKIYEIQMQDSIDTSAFSHLFPTESSDRFVISEANRELLASARIRFQVIREIESSSLRKRIIYPYRMFLYATPDEEALEEVCAKLVASKQGEQLPSVVFLGRNSEPEPGAFFLDRVGRGRRYQWKLSFQGEPEKSLTETFPNISSVLADADTRVVLSFGAGGLRFLAHASFMKFINALGAKRYVDEVWGVSGGAFSAYAYAMGVLPEDLEEKGYDIYNQRHDLRITPSRWRVLRTRIMNRLLPASPFMLQDYALMQMIMKRALKQLTRERRLEIPFFCTAYNVKEERNEVFSASEGKEPYQGFIKQVEPLESIIASSAIPVIFTPKVIRHEDGSEDAYIDGSVTEEIPILPVYRKWRLDQERGGESRQKLLILAVNTFPQVSKRIVFERGWKRKLPFADFLRFALKIFDLVITTRMDEEFETLSMDARVKLIRVNFPLKTPALLDSSAIPTIIQNAQSHLVERMLEVENELSGLWGI